MRYEITRIGIWSFVRVFFPVNFIVGLLVGIVAAPVVVVLLASLYTLFLADTGPFGTPPDIAWLEEGTIWIPLLSAAAAAIVNTTLGILVIAVYNVLSGMTGGLAIRLGDEIKESQSTTGKVSTPVVGTPALAGAAPSSPRPRYPGAPPPPPPLGDDGRPQPQAPQAPPRPAQGPKAYPSAIVPQRPKPRPSDGDRQ